MRKFQNSFLTVFCYLFTFMVIADTIWNGFSDGWAKVKPLAGELIVCFLITLSAYLIGIRRIRKEANS